MYQYNNIYAGSYKYLKEKNTNRRLKKKKMAQQNGTVDVQRKNTGCTMIYIKGKKKVQIEDWRKKKKKLANQNGTVDEQWKTLYEQCKNTVEKRAQIDD